MPPLSPVPLTLYSFLLCSTVESVCPEGTPFWPLYLHSTYFPSDPNTAVALVIYCWVTHSETCKSKPCHLGWPSISRGSPAKCGVDWGCRHQRAPRAWNVHHGLLRGSSHCWGLAKWLASPPCDLSSSNGILKAWHLSRNDCWAVLESGYNGQPWEPNLFCAIVMLKTQGLRLRPDVDRTRLS